MDSFYVCEAFQKKKKFTHAECIALTCIHIYLFKPATKEYKTTLNGTGWRKTERRPPSAADTISLTTETGKGSVLVAGVFHTMSQVFHAAVYSSPQTPLPPHDACLHGGRCKRSNQDAQAVTRACKEAIHWKLDGELISSALLGHGLLIASGMSSPFQALSLQAKKHVLRSYGDWWRSQIWPHQCSGVYWSTQFSNSSHSTPLALIAGLTVFQWGAAAAYTA